MSDGRDGDRWEDGGWEILGTNRLLICYLISGLFVT